MALEMKAIRRIVTGNDEAGNSTIIFDSDAPNVNVGTIAASAGMTDVWVFKECPANISGHDDDGNLPFSFDPPGQGGHLRIVQSAAKPKDYDPLLDTTAAPITAPFQRKGSHTWDKGGKNAYSSPIHQSQTVDYGFVMEGSRTLILDDEERVLLPGDVVVQLANWHGWKNPDDTSLMGFIMMGSEPGPEVK
ncbi:MAG: hypothetical protein WCK52_02430 [Betaproteobacteria bacterium]